MASAKYGPRRRSTGSMMTAAMAAPAPPSSMAANTGTPSFTVVRAETYAPTPKNAAWPKLTMPPRLPSRAQDMATPPMTRAATTMLITYWLPPRASGTAIYAASSRPAVEINVERFIRASVVRRTGRSA